ncbi:hypothetical protein AGMMS49546_19850 [Spirochaetia bacterium]|nr:hypothetical protein AGMMS49546_19850 [Spirochaetia bacterium]
MNLLKTTDSKLSMAIHTIINNEDAARESASNIAMGGFAPNQYSGQPEAIREWAIEEIWLVMRYGQNMIN